VLPDEKDDGPRWRPISRFPGNIDSPTPGPWVDVDFGACSRRGQLRAVNDDHYLILRLGRHMEAVRSSLPPGEIPPRFDEFAYSMVIADGMGRDAEAASRLAIATFAQLAVHFGKWHVRIDAPVADEVMDRATSFFKNIDTALLEAAGGNPAGLQTTLTAILSAGDELFFAYVGNSPVYLFRDGALAPLTRDHSLEDERTGPAATVQLPDFTYVEPDMLGGTRLARPRVDVERCGLRDGDSVLLCTKGLTDFVEESRIAETLRLHRTPDEQCRALVDLAVRSGSHDDVTTLIGQYHISATHGTGG
jgi:serine/threonine protein phosphatase PrpC